LANYTQYGFFFDQSRCTACQACVVACKDWNGLSAGPEKWLRVFSYEKGAFPNVRIHTLFVPCFHCENPVCVDAADGAMYKEEKYGAVLIDPAKANDLRKAAAACPYGAIVFQSDAFDAEASKCTMCVDRLEQNLLPICVTACPTRALDFGKMDDLRAKYGSVSDLEDLPPSSITKPAAIFKAHGQKKQVVPYDAAKALLLLAKRDPLPQLYYGPTDVTDTQGYVKKSKPMLKPDNTEELQYFTENDNS
jgi:anaerobic dimethyl sulfoxide reductase subunit B (iron-sulfur subunit)